MKWVHFGTASLAVCLCLPVLLTACGNNGQLSVTLSGLSQGGAKPGDTPSGTVTVVNQGPGQATGVLLTVTIDGDSRYQATTSVDETSAARTQPIEPKVNSPAPSWGQWTLSAPSTAADGTVTHSRVAITFSVKVGSTSGKYLMAPRVLSDQSDGEVGGAPVLLQVNSAPDIHATIGVSPHLVVRGDQVTYRVVVTNEGTGTAQNVGVLVPLPQGFAFSDSNPPQLPAHTPCGASRSSPVDPVPQTALFFSGGWDIPAHSSQCPGLLTLSFHAQCLQAAFGGQFPVNVQVTDASGDVVNASDSQSISVSAPTAPTTPTPDLAAGSSSGSQF